jgi:hypothetical protein
MEKAAISEELKRQHERDAARPKLDALLNGIYYAVRAAQRDLTVGRLEKLTAQIDRCRDAATIIKKCLPTPPKLSSWATSQIRVASVYEALTMRGAQRSESR